MGPRHPRTNPRRGAVKKPRLYYVRNSQWNDWLGGTAPVTWEGSVKRAGSWPLEEANLLAGKLDGYVLPVDEELPE